MALKSKKNRDWLVILLFLAINFFIVTKIKLNSFVKSSKEPAFNPSLKIVEIPKQEPQFVFVNNVEEENKKEVFYLENELKKAKTYNKHIFVYFGAEWCGWCKTMQLKTLNDSVVKNELEKFVMAYVDKDENKEFCKKYDIQGIPAYIVMDKNGSLLQRSEGFREKESFLQWLQPVLPKNLE